MVVAQSEHGNASPWNRVIVSRGAVEVATTDVYVVVTKTVFVPESSTVIVEGVRVEVTVSTTRHAPRLPVDNVLARVDIDVDCTSAAVAF